MRAATQRFQGKSARQRLAPYDSAMRILAHGIDIVEVARIVRMLHDHGERFLERCFTDVEQAYAQATLLSSPAPGPGISKRSAERLAARFACKEAVFKALGTGWKSGISWRDVGVVHEPSGQPSLVLTGRCAELAGELGIARWHVSLSHTDSMAIASVIGIG